MAKEPLWKRAVRRGFDAAFREPRSCNFEQACRLSGVAIDNLRRYLAGADAPSEAELQRRINLFFNRLQELERRIAATWKQVWVSPDDTRSKPQHASVAEHRTRIDLKVTPGTSTKEKEIEDFVLDRFHTGTPRDLHEVIFVFAWERGQLDYAYLKRRASELGVEAELKYFWRQSEPRDSQNQV
jgi:hypothetical protein